MRLTDSTVNVAAALMRRPDALHWGYELSRESGVKAGTLYPVLTRFLVRGWLTDGWEDQAKVAGRPARRYYKLTETGQAELGAMISKASVDPRFTARRRIGGPRLSGGVT